MEIIGRRLTISLLTACFLKLFYSLNRFDNITQVIFLGGFMSFDLENEETCEEVINCPHCGGDGCDECSSSSLGDEDLFDDYEEDDGYDYDEYNDEDEDEDDEDYDDED